MQRGVGLIALRQRKGAPRGDDGPVGSGAEYPVRAGMEPAAQDQPPLQLLHVRAPVPFFEDAKAPIFAFTIKNKYGMEITGTNTMFEKAFLDSVKKGDVKEITFRQRVDLQGGEYLISLGCTGYEGEDFTVYHRLYDVMGLTVVSDKNSVGYYDMNSVVTVTDAT